jgi:hypothetical protein
VIDRVWNQTPGVDFGAVRSERERRARVQVVQTSEFENSR